MKLTKLHLFLILIFSLIVAGGLGYNYAIMEGMTTSDSSVKIFLNDGTIIQGIKQDKLEKGREADYNKYEVVVTKDISKDLTKEIVTYLESPRGEIKYKDHIYILKDAYIVTTNTNITETEKYLYVLKTSDKYHNTSNPEAETPTKSTTNSFDDLYILKTKIVVPTCPVGLTYGPVNPEAEADAISLNKPSATQTNQSNTNKPNKETGLTGFSGFNDFNVFAEINSNQQQSQSSQLSQMPHTPSNNFVSQYNNFSSFRPLNQDTESLPMPVLSDFSAFGM